MQAFFSGNKTAEYSSGSETSQLVFEYTVTSEDKSMDLAYTGQNALKLNGGRISNSDVEVKTLTLPKPGEENSLSDSKNIKFGLSDDFNKASISKQWVQLDKDNHDMNGDGDTTNDQSMVFFQDKGSLTLNGRGRDVWRRRHEFVGVYLNDQAIKQ